MWRLQVATPLAMGVGGLAAGQWGAGAMGMVLAALGALVFYLWCAAVIPPVLPYPKGKTPASTKALLRAQIAANLWAHVHGRLVSAAQLLPEVTSSATGSTTVHSYSLVHRSVAAAHHACNPTAALPV